MNDRLTVLQGDCVAMMRTMESGSVQTCVTSPPYWGLRDYGTAKWEGGDAACNHVERNGINDLTPEALARRSEKYRTGIGAASKVSEIQFSDICAKCGARRIDSQLGLESTPEEYVSNMVAVFREVWRVLRDDGTLWLNMGDCYASNGACGGGSVFDNPTDGRPEYAGKNGGRPVGREADRSAKLRIGGTAKNGLKP